MRPAQAQEKMMEPLVKTIVNLVNEGRYHSADIRQLAKPIRLGTGTKILFKLLAKTALTNIS